MKVGLLMLILSLPRSTPTSANLSFRTHRQRKWLCPLSQQLRGTVAGTAVIMMRHMPHDTITIPVSKFTILFICDKNEGVITYLVNLGNESNIVHGNASFPIRVDFKVWKLERLRIMLNSPCIAHLLHRCTEHLVNTWSEKWLSHTTYCSHEVIKKMKGYGFPNSISRKSLSHSTPRAWPDTC